MANFADGDGRTWELILEGLGSIKHIRKRTGITLTNIYEDSTQQALSADFEKMAEIVWVLIEQQAKEAKVSFPEFEKQLQGQVLEDMREALRAEVSDFLPSQERDFFQMQPLLAQLDHLPPDMKDKMTAEMMDGMMEQMESPSRISTESAGELPDDLELTPAG